MKSKSTKLLEKIKKPYNRLGSTDKKILWIFVGSFLLSMSITMMISGIRNYDSDLSVSECNSVANFRVDYYLSLQEESNVLAFLYRFNLQFTILIIAIAIGWVFHGVGFKVVGR